MAIARSNDNVTMGVGIVTRKEEPQVLSFLPRWDRTDQYCRSRLERKRKKEGARAREMEGGGRRKKRQQSVRVYLEEVLKVQGRSSFVTS